MNNIFDRIIKRFVARGGPSPFSVSDCNVIVDRLNAWQRAKIVRGSKDEVIITPAQVVISYKGGGTSSDGGTTPAGGTEAKQFELISHQGDHLVCKDLVTNENLNIAKQQELRYSVTGETIDDDTHVYTAHDTLKQTRSNKWGNELNQTQKEVIVPRYKVGKLITAIPAVTNVTVNGLLCTWVEAQDGRAWARIKGDQFFTGTIEVGVLEQFGDVTFDLSLTPPLRVWLQYTGGDALYAWPMAGSLKTTGFGWALNAPPTNNCQIYYSIEVQ